MRFLCVYVIFFIHCVEISVSVVTLPLIINKYFLLGINICIGNSPICNTVKITFHESGLTIYNRFHYAFNQSATAEFIEERDTSFILADEVTMLQNSNTGNTIHFKNFKFKYSENSFGVDAGHLGLSYKENDANILHQLFSSMNVKKVFYFDIKKFLLVIGEYPPQYYELLRFKRNVKTVEMLENKNGEIGYRYRIDSVYFKGKKEKTFYFPVDSIANISPSNNNIYVSLELMTSIVDYYFPNEFFSEEKCQNIVDSDSNVIECMINSIDISKMNSITFIFNKISIRLHPSDLFLQFNKKLYFAVAYYKNAVPFSFGYPLLSRYHIVNDIANRKIIFTPNN